MCASLGILEGILYSSPLMLFVGGGCVCVDKKCVFSTDGERGKKVKHSCMCSTDIQSHLETVTLLWYGETCFCIKPSCSLYFFSCHSGQNSCDWCASSCWDASFYTFLCSGTHANALCLPSLLLLFSRFSLTFTSEDLFWAVFWGVEHSFLGNSRSRFWSKFQTEHSEQHSVNFRPF